MKFIVYFLLFNQAFGFVRRYSLGVKTRLYNSINPLIYEDELQQKSISELLEHVEDTDKIFLRNDMKKAYTRKDIGGDGVYDMEDYSVTNIDASLSNMIIDKASKKNVPVTILEPYNSPLNTLISGTYSIFNGLFVSTLVLLLIRTIIGVFRSNGSPMGPIGPMGTNNRFSSFGSMKDNDKENMIKSNISLSSWAGSPEIFRECTEVVSYLNNRTKYQEAGAEIPRGILLEGPPGTGKTLIAKAIASECDANFISIAASEFVELYVGMGASKVRSLFRQARDQSPCIIFIDEIDAVGKQRGTGVNMGNDEREQTLNQILAEMDGFSLNENVLIIGATNRKDVLDDALLRPGRFDRIINIPLPDKSSRLSILNVHLRNKTYDENINLQDFAGDTSGFSGAQLKNLINEAAINAVRIGKTKISNKNMKDALEKLTVGIIKENDTRSDEALLRIALHEIGHAFLAASFDQYFEVKKVSIQSTYSGAGGYTLFKTHSDISESGLYTKDMLMKRLIVCLGGKAAESVFYGDNFVSLGAQQDLKQANSLAKNMVGNYGMGNKLKTFYNDNMDNSDNPFLGRALATNSGMYSEFIKDLFDKEVKELVDEAYNYAFQIIHSNQNMMNILANILLQTNTMDGKFLMEYIHIKNYNETSNGFQE
jgi:cell division protease FtsH